MTLPIMRRILGIVAFIAFAVIGLPLVRAQTTPSSPSSMDMRPFATNAAQLFSPQSLNDPASDLNTLCDNVLLCFQAVSAVLIIAALVNKIRKEHTQMEGVAATLLKVAFIATIPTWRGLCLDAADSMATSIGYQVVMTNDVPSPVMNDLWNLLGQWAPASTPYLDALEAQNANNAPASGGEQDWGLRSWNWARGVGAADAALFPSLWQATSGSVRAFVVFATCGLMVCAVSLTIILTCFGEVVRHLLFYGGCAMLPLFIAGLGIDALRAQAIRAILAVVSIALWPLAWASANLVTHVFAGGTQQWMADVAGRALTAAGMPAASFGVAVPYIAWSALFLFVGATLAVCLWVTGSVFFGPMLLTRALSSGVAALSRVFVSASWYTPAGFSSIASVDVPRAASAASRKERVQLIVAPVRDAVQPAWNSSRMPGVSDRVAPSMAATRSARLLSRDSSRVGRN